MDRRFFLQSAAWSAFMTSVPRWALATVDNWPLRPEPANPLLKTAETSSLDFNGDDISRPHDILWDKAGYMASKGGIPPISETIPLVIIGGGISGLSAAYTLRDLKPLLLEQAPQFGGNSKGEILGQTAYSIGAAYLVKPDEGSAVETLLKELSLDQQVREEKSEDLTVLFEGKFQKPFWKGATDPQAALEFQRIQKVFKNILENQYPDIPRSSESQVSNETFNQWDSISFKAWMQKNLGSVHPHVEEYLQLYAWSSFCGSLSEISAAQMLNFITSETDSIWALPGGNAAIAEKMYQKLKLNLGENALRAGCFVLDVRANADGVQIVYEDGQRNLKSIQAKACIFASPKFVASKVVSGLSAEQEKAIAGFSYRSYLVANLHLKNKISSPSYELFDLKGQAPEDPRAMNPSDRKFTDICFGSWAAEPEVDRSVITIYKGLAYDGARQFLFNPLAHDKNKAQIENQIPEVLRALNLKESDVAGIRMTRWGHALPLAQVGGISSGAAARASMTVAGRIVFANQDNWLNPSFEAAFGSAQQAASEIRKILSQLI